VPNTDYKNQVHTPDATVESNSVRISALKELLQTKFEDIQTLLDERDRRTQVLFDERDRRYMERFGDEHSYIITLSEERSKRYEILFHALDEKLMAIAANSEKAVNKADTATEKRFESVNEFRGQLKDQTATLMPRGEVDARFNAYDGKLDDIKDEIQKLREFKSESTGKEIVQIGEKGDRQWSIGLVVTSFLAVLALMVAAGDLLAHIIK
jgi:hypothetical protein